MQESSFNRARLFSQFHVIFQGSWLCKESKNVLYVKNRKGESKTKSIFKICVYMSAYTGKTVLNM